MCSARDEKQNSKIETAAGVQRRHRQHGRAQRAPAVHPGGEPGDGGAGSVDVPAAPAVVGHDRRHPGLVGGGGRGRRRPPDQHGEGEPVG